MADEKELWLEQNEIQNLLEGALTWEEIHERLQQHPAENRQIDLTNIYKTEAALTAPGMTEDTPIPAPVSETSPSPAASTGHGLEEVPADMELPDGRETPPPEQQSEGPEIRNEEALDIQTTEAARVVLERKILTGKEVSLLDDEVIEDAKRPFWSGAKLVALLIVVTAATFAVWYYYLSQG